MSSGRVLRILLGRANKFQQASHIEQEGGVRRRCRGCLASVCLDIVNAQAQSASTPRPCGSGVLPQWARRSLPSPRIECSSGPGRCAFDRIHNTLPYSETSTGGAMCSSRKFAARVASSRGFHLDRNITDGIQDCQHRSNHGATGLAIAIAARRRDEPFHSSSPAAGTANRRALDAHYRGEDVRESTRVVRRSQS